MPPPISTLTTTPSASTSFRNTFGGQAEIIVRAPGRVNLIGEHVDYQGGIVMPAAIDRYIIGSARAISTSEIRLWSSLDHRLLNIALDHDLPLNGDDHWANYVFGVVAKYRAAGFPISGFEATFDTDLPIGAGLSSSAALESATALMIETILGIQLPPTQRALLCQAAEHDWAGVPCGLMDQLAVNAGVDGHALKIDCRTLEITPEPLPPEISLVVVDSHVKHTLADGEYARRKADCETAARLLQVDSLRDTDLDQLNLSKPSMENHVFRRARHVITEINRVHAFTKALESSDISTAGILMGKSHASLRDDFEVSCPELDDIVRIANQLGAIGSRMMGGGFGGSTINLVQSSKAQHFASTIVERYLAESGTQIHAFIVSPVAGASVEFPTPSL